MQLTLVLPHFRKHAQLISAQALTALIQQSYCAI